MTARPSGARLVVALGTGAWFGSVVPVGRGQRVSMRRSSANCNSDPAGIGPGAAPSPSWPERRYQRPRRTLRSRRLRQRPPLIRAPRLRHQRRLSDGNPGGVIHVRSTPAPSGQLVQIANAATVVRPYNQRLRAARGAPRRFRPGWREHRRPSLANRFGWRADSRPSASSVDGARRKAEVSMVALSRNAVESLVVW